VNTRTLTQWRKRDEDDWELGDHGKIIVKYFPQMDALCDVHSMKRMPKELWGNHHDNMCRWMLWRNDVGEDAWATVGNPWQGRHISLMDALTKRCLLNEENILWAVWKKPRVPKNELVKLSVWACRNCETRVDRHGLSSVSLRSPAWVWITRDKGTKLQARLNQNESMCQYTTKP
jgi:hypothetical protein